MNLFTERQESQIREALNRVIECGTAHIVLGKATLEHDDTDNYIKWYTVEGYQGYHVRGNMDSDETFFNDKHYVISVGVFPDRRRHVLTALNRSQHE